jgi:sulfur carrier protein ThiS
MPTNNDYYYGYYGYDVDAPFNEFTQFIVMKPYTWLVGKVPNINNLLNVFSNLINDHNGVIVGGYLRRVIRSGDAFTFQNADLDIMFQSLDDFLGAAEFVNQGNLIQFSQPDMQEISTGKVLYNWDLISNTSDIPNIKLQLIRKESDSIENILSSFDFTNAKIATNLNQVIIDSRWEHFELNKIINIDQIKPSILHRLLKYLYSEGEPFRLNDSSASKLLAWVSSRLT